VTLKADVFPVFGHKHVDTIRSAEIRDLMLAVVKRDARDVAKRCHEMTSQIFRFAVARDIASRNPAAEFKPRDILAAARTENPARIDAKDLPELLPKMSTLILETRIGLLSLVELSGALCCLDISRLAVTDSTISR
jgi:hypothetical protein